MVILILEVITMLLRFRKLCITVVSLCVISTFTQSALAMEEGGSSQQDPLSRINYRDAFDQKKIHKKFEWLMRELGCAENVFGPDDSSAIVIDIRDDKSLQPSCTQSSWEFLRRLALELTLQDPDQSPYLTQQDYERACVNCLQAARRWAITEPARESMTLMGLMGCAVAAIKKMVGPESMGGSFGIFTGLFNAAFLCRPCIRSCYNWQWPPAHPLNDLEGRFAKNQCFIPKALWRVIIEKFMIARNNQFQQRECTDFIEFALGLTTYKPKPEIKIDGHPVDEHSVTRAMEILSPQIDQFFADYEDQEDGGKSILFIKLNVYKFLQVLVGKTDEAPRYIHLHGPGGIGKTHFVYKLSEWINKIIPNSIRFEDLVITSAEELEGSVNRPGAILRVLRNQVIEDKRGSIVFMDEATWLNREDMISPAKRVFNGNLANLSTAYFGGGIEGAGIKLKLPPMLIFVASNEEIKDAALKSRFDTILFPSPTQQTLTCHAQEIVRENGFLRSQNLADKTIDIAQLTADFIREEEIKNFREVKSKIIPFILSKIRARQQLVVERKSSFDFL